jgi:hypothetical protein
MAERVLQIWLPANGGTQVTISVPWSALGYWDPVSQQDVTEAADYVIKVCHDSATCPSANQHTIAIPTTTMWDTKGPAGRFGKTYQ